MPTVPEISVIIVSYNTRSLLLKCLDAVRSAIEGENAEIIVIDNASGDGSVEAVRKEFPEVRIIESSTNAGFGAANNIAMKEARGEFFLLLNSDAFLRPGSISILVEEMKRHPSTGVLGPRLLNVDGSLQVSCYKFPSPARVWIENAWLSAIFPGSARLGDYRRWTHDSEREVDWVIGACMLVRRRVFEEVGGFDSRFFMYAEESDWQLRIRKAGWAITFTPSLEVVHVGGASGSTEPARINRHFFESLDYYVRKHHGLAGLFSVRIAMVVGCSLRMVLWLCASLISSRQRARALKKSRFHALLAMRQLSTWNFTSVRT